MTARHFTRPLAALLILTSQAIAQDQPCRLAGNLIQLDDIDLIYHLNPEAVKRDAARDAGDDFFDDGVQGGATKADCDASSIVGRLRCDVINQMNPGDSNAPPTPGDTVSANGSAGGGADGKPAFDPAARDLENSDAVVTIPARRYLQPGNPAKIFTVPADRPRIKSSSPIKPDGMKRLQDAVYDNVVGLGKAAFDVTPAAMDQLMNGGNGYTIPLPPNGKDDIMLMAPISNGAKMPAECVSYLKMQQDLMALAKKLQDKAKECDAISGQIKAHKAATAKSDIFARGAEFFGVDSTLNKLEASHAQCSKQANDIRAQMKPINERAKKRRARIVEDQHRADIAAIKADPKLLAAEEKSREMKAIAARARYEGHLAKMQDGMNAYNANLRSFDDAIATLEASNDPEKDQKIADLKRERERYEATYASWLEQMEVSRVSREKDFNRAMRENQADGIGPKSNRELRQRLTDQGLNPTEVLSSQFGEGVQFATRQAELDRASLGGDTTLGQSTQELLTEVAVDYYTMSPAERLRRMRDYGPAALQGIGEGVYDGVEGLVKLGAGIGKAGYTIQKGAMDLVAESAGYEGFEGSTADALVGGYNKAEEHFSQDKLAETYMNKVTDTWNKIDTSFNRGFEKLAGQGKKGVEEGVRMFAKGGTMAVGGEAALFQGASKLNAMYKGWRGLDAGADVARGVDLASDINRTADQGSDLARAADAPSDLTRTGDALNDATRTVDPAADVSRTEVMTNARQGADAAGDANRTVTTPGDASRTVTTPGDATAPMTPTEIANAQIQPPNPDIVNRARRFKKNTEAARAQEALEAAGVEPAFARVFAAKAVEDSADLAIAGAALEKGLPPGPLLRSGKITEEGLRKGMRQYLDDMGKTPAERDAIINRAMSRPDPTAAAPRMADPNTPAGKTARLAPEGGPTSAPTPETAPTARLDSPETAPTARMDSPETAPTARMSPETAPTERLSNADRAALAEDARPTARLDSPETAPTVRMDSPETAPTARLDSPETAPTARMDNPETAPTARMDAPEQPRSATDGSKSTQPAKDAHRTLDQINDMPLDSAAATRAATDGSKSAQSAQDAHKTLDQLNDALLPPPVDPNARAVGRFSRAELQQRLASTVDDAATKLLSPAEAAGLKAPTTRMPTPETAPTARLDPADAPTARRDPADAPTARLDPADAPTARLDPADAPTARLDPADAPTARLDPENAPTMRLDPADAPTARLDPANTPTERLSNSDVAALAEDARPTVRLDPADAPTTRLDPADAPTTRLDPVDAPTARLDPVDAPTTRLDPADAPTARLDPANTPTARLDPTDTPTARLDPGDNQTARLSNSDVAALAEDARPTARLNPEQAPTARISPETAPTARISPPETAPTARLPAPDTTPTARLPAPDNTPTARLDPPATPDGPETVRLAQPDQPFGPPEGKVPFDPDPVQVRTNATGGVDLTHNGRTISIDRANEIGRGSTAAVYGSDAGPNVLKVSKNDPVSQNLDVLGREAMEGRIAIPGLKRQYRIGEGSTLPGDVPAAGGKVSVLERGPEPFSKIADGLKETGEGFGSARRAALNDALGRMNRDGYVVLDLKGDNFGFVNSANQSTGRSLDFVALDEGMVLKFKPEFAEYAAQAQKILLDPGNAIRALPEQAAVMDLRDRMSMFDRFVDWGAMNGGRADGPLQTLGNAGANAVPYTPTLGLRFDDLTGPPLPGS
ncbi:hypothetical protein [Pseudooceanicola sp. MF1-13]|uniref:hypothetical protein n=1 Tax=Pseudooceanicola sp. MF1-13 TaxID=3379095 RepID=UPI003891E08A